MALWDDKQPGSFQRVVEQAAGSVVAVVVLYIAAVALGVVQHPGVVPRIGAVFVSLLMISSLAALFLSPSRSAGRELRVWELVLARITAVVGAAGMLWIMVQALITGHV